MPTVLERSPMRPAATGRAGASLVVTELTVQRGRHRLLHAVDLEIRAGELVAVAGPSGSGKTTLLETVAGLRRPTAGGVLVGGVPTRELAGSGRIGLVPQDDVVHLELPLRHTLRQTARIRLSDPATELDAQVDAVLARLGLADRAHVAVGALSGGQRKRSSIAAELLSHPEVLLLDEPTSGLDPSSAAGVVRALRELTAAGTTVVLTTHDPIDIASCDRVVFLAAGGQLAFVGPPADAPRAFGVQDLVGVYTRLADGPTPTPAATTDARAVAPSLPTPPPDNRPAAAPPAPRVRQLVTLVQRNAQITAANRLTLAVLVGSPALVIAMMAVLFRPGAFDRATANPMGPAQTVFWIAFAGFFFGLTYGLLQVVGERAILQRERYAGLRPGTYLAAKVVLLLPLLVVVAASMVGVLRLLDRLPAAGWATYALLLSTLVLEELAGLTLGLAASAIVRDPAQATLALPLLCFPQVLFAGAVVPVDQMAGLGRAISVAMVNRWAFEALGRALSLQGGAVGAPNHDAFSGSVAAGWFALSLLAAAAGGLAVLAVSRRAER